MASLLQHIGNALGLHLRSAKDRWIGMADQNVRDWADIDPAFSSNVSWGRETGLSSAAVANFRIRLTEYPSWVRPVPGD
jgi:hypothetical protein